MYLAAYALCEERSVTFFTTPNLPLVVKKVEEKKMTSEKQNYEFLIARWLIHFVIEYGKSQLSCESFVTQANSEKGNPSAPIRNRT